MIQAGGSSLLNMCFHNCCDRKKGISSDLTFSKKKKNCPDSCVENGLWGSKGGSRETIEGVWSGLEEMMT